MTVVSLKVAAPTHWPDVTVLFEDVDLIPGTDTPITWRVVIFYQDPDSWVIGDVQVNAPGKAWADLPSGHALLAILMERTGFCDLREQIDTAILADMQERGVEFDDGWGREMRA